MLNKQFFEFFGDYEHLKKSQLIEYLLKFYKPPRLFQRGKKVLKLIFQHFHKKI